MENNFFDLQINGYGGVDFNRNELTAKSLHTACSKLKENGVKGILATIITADFEDMKLRLKHIAKFRNEDDLIKEVIYGIHIEGPFLNDQPGFRGVHQPEYICPANLDKMKYLLEAADGLTKIVTLSPEVDNGFNLTKMLAGNNIVVSAGHCNSTIEELKGAIDAGLSLFTHLGNGCPQSLHRHDNIIQRALFLRDKLKFCFIADGIHIPFFALKNYLDLAGFENSIVVTDAMAAGGAIPGKYTLGDLILEVGEDRIVSEPGKSNFAGSAITMKKSRENLINKLGIDEKNGERLTSVNPMKVMGIY